MLPGAERLRKAGLFQRVYTARKNVSAKHLALYVLPRLAQSSPKLPLTGFVVGKKVYAEATRRNKAKRRVREAYRQIRREADGALKELKLKKWYAIVWVVQGDILSQGWLELKENVMHCLEKAGEKYGDRRVLK